MKRRKLESGALEDEPAATDAAPRPPVVAALRLSGVSLLTRTEEGDVSVPDLGLTFDESGLTVSKASGEVVRLIPWPSLSEISSEAAGRPNGVNPAALVRVSTGERVHRFVVPAVDAGALDQRLSDVTQRYKAPATGEPHERGGTNGAPVVGLAPPPPGSPSVSPPRSARAAAPPPGASAPAAPPGAPAATSQQRPPPNTSLAATAPPPPPGPGPTTLPAGAPPPPAPGAPAGGTKAPPDDALSASRPPGSPPPPSAPPPSPHPPSAPAVPGPSDSAGTAGGLGAALSSPVPVAPASSRRRGRRRGEAEQAPRRPPPPQFGGDAWASGGHAGQAASEPGPSTNLLPVVAGAPAGEAAGGSAFTEPPRPAGTRTAAERRRRRSIWALAVLLVIVAVLVGLYVAQREGLIHFLPKSIASSPTTTTAVTGASRTQGSAGGTAPAAATSPIPGMTSSDVTNLAQALEFHCVQASSTLTTCSQPANSAVLNVTGVPGGNVRLVTLTVGGLPGNPVVGNLVPKVAQLPYQGAQPAAASTWTHAHETSSGQVVIGSARLTMTSLPSQTILQISAA